MSVVNSGAGGVNGGYGGDEGEEIGRQEMEKFEVADGEATRVVIALSRVVSGPGRTFENSGGMNIFTTPNFEATCDC